MDNLDINSYNIQFDKPVTPRSNKLNDSIFSSPISHQINPDSGTNKKPKFLDWVPQFVPMMQHSLVFGCPRFCKF